MSWERFDSGTHNCLNIRYGQSWLKWPLIVIKESGIICNELFITTFSLKEKETINVFFDSKRKKIGFQRPTDNASALAGYKVQKHGKQLLISCKKASKKFPGYLDKPFLATLNTSERIIEVQLS